MPFVYLLVGGIGGALLYQGIESTAADWGLFPEATAGQVTATEPRDTRAQLLGAGLALAGAGLTAYLLRKG